MGRLAKLPPYLFSEIDAARQAAVAAGVDVVDLGIGDPDLPTPQSLIDHFSEAVRDSANHCYPAGRGDAALRQTIADWLSDRHSVRVDPETQILVLIGSKEGLGHLPLTCIEEGDNTLVPDIGYPVYPQATILAGGQPRYFPLLDDDLFLPDVSRLDRLADERTRLMYLNYPNNPTGAIATAELWRDCLDFGERRGLVVANDAAYSEVTLNGSRPVSLLSVADVNRQPVIEFFSLSKMFNMTGWRIGFAAGHPEVISNLARVKESVDSGVFSAIQRVAQFALGDAFTNLLASVMAPYPSRKRMIVDALTAAGYEIFSSAATFYVWVHVPPGEDSLAFSKRLLDQIGVVVTPGVGFGSGGEGWFRISLTAADDRIAAAAERFARL